MIYFCDIKVNSLPNQKLLYENFLYIISDACMFTYLIKPKIRKAVFRIIKKNFLIYSRKKERMVMVLLSSLVPRNHRSLANQKTGNIFSQFQNSSSHPVTFFNAYVMTSISRIHFQFFKFWTPIRPKLSCTSLQIMLNLFS